MDENERKIRIFLVDDDKSLRETFQEILEMEGYNVKTACDGLEAWHELSNANLSPDVLITDFQMPQMDGVELIEKAKKKFPQLPAILVTTCPAEIIPLNKANAIRSKPINRSLLTSVIQSVLYRTARGCMA